MESDLKCGLSRWTPRFLQRFANSWWFLFVFGSVGTVQGMCLLYFAGTLTTVERRFGFQSANSAPITTLATAVGYIVSGYVISVYKPRTTYVLGWNVFVGLICVLCQVSEMFLLCSDVQISGFDPATRQFHLVNDCNNDCACENVTLSPVCLNDTQLTFFSPCHAGCTQFISQGKYNLYRNCSCVPVQPVYNLSSRGTALQHDEVEYQTYSGTVVDGYCIPDCGFGLILYLALIMMNVLGPTGKVGNVILNYRVVEMEDKSFSTGITLFVISLFGFIPGPIIFGSIVDACCLLWDTSCGRKGSCLFYDKSSFFFYFNGCAALMTAMSVVLDAIVFYLGKDVNLY